MVVFFRVATYVATSAAVCRSPAGVDRGCLLGGGWPSPRTWTIELDIRVGGYFREIFKTKRAKRYSLVFTPTKSFFKTKQRPHSPIPPDTIQVGGIYSRKFSQGSSHLLSSVPALNIFTLPSGIRLFGFFLLLLENFPKKFLVNFLIFLDFWKFL